MRVSHANTSERPAIFMPLAEVLVPLVAASCERLHWLYWNVRKYVYEADGASPAQLASCSRDLVVQAEIWIAAARILQHMYYTSFASSSISHAQSCAIQRSLRCNKKAAAGHCFGSGRRTLDCVVCRATVSVWQIERADKHKRVSDLASCCVHCADKSRA